jgi:hypothetical protein
VIIEECGVDFHNDTSIPLTLKSLVLKSKCNFIQVYVILWRGRSKFLQLVPDSFVIKYVQITGLCVPVRTRVRINTPHPLVCRKRRPDGVVLRMRLEKPRSRVTAGVAR